MLSEADRTRVAAAVTRAEASTDGEIVTIVSGRSDAYHDVALHWAVLAMIATLALIAFRPTIVEHIYARLIDPWAQVPPIGALFAVALVLMALVFLLVRLVFAWTPLRLALTPPSTKGRRVHARALLLFRAGTEQRTKAATGVLLFLSLAERRAEIIAEASIHDRVAPEIWGAAMAALIAAVRDGRPGDGMADAVAQIGVVLADHFPISAGDTNELPDRVIEV